MNPEDTQNELVSEVIADLVESVEELQDEFGVLEDKVEKVSKQSGPKGELGDQGPRGDSGLRGEKGERGDTGKTGEKGEKGESGQSTEVDIKKVVKELKKEVKDDLKPLVYEVIGNMQPGGGNANRNIQVDGVNVLTPFTDINLVTGGGLSISVAANQLTKYMDFTLSASGGGGYQQPTSGVVDGSNAVFEFSTAPSVISVDQGRVMQQTSSDGTINWTGTTTVTLAVAPNFDVFGLA